MSGPSTIRDPKNPERSALVSAQGNLQVSETASSFFAGRATVATPGTSVQLTATSTPVSGVTVKALSTNTGSVYVGIASGDARATGFELLASEAVYIAINDVNKVWVDASAASQAVCYVGS